MFTVGAKRESERDSEVLRELAGGGEDSAALQPGLQPALWRGLSLVLSIILRVSLSIILRVSFQCHKNK